jgi:Holliday junction resolvase-like predicted endonuclease
MRTTRQRRGTEAEEIVVRHLEQAGWLVVSRNAKVGRDEIDIMAVDPGPPQELVFVEVRSATSDAFGAPEERIDRAKVRNLYRAMRQMPSTLPLARRVDLFVVDARAGPVAIRHLRRLEPA